MNRIDKKFKDLKIKKEKALIVFITAGDPSLKKSQELVLAFEKDGVDLIELGVPFSDPLADGPVIQAASNRSLAHGTNLVSILKLVRDIRKKSQIPLLLMSYLNPILAYGYKKFGEDARRSGVDGVIIPDLPPDNERDFVGAMKKNDIDIVYLLAPTSTAQRAKKITQRSRGFIYYVSLTGITGAHQKLSSAIGQKVSQAKHFTKTPVCVGFGISNPSQAVEAVKKSDGVIVGSALVKALAENVKLRPVEFSRRFVRPFAKALGKQ